MQPLGLLKRIIGFLILMTAAVWPVCGQEAKTGLKPDVVQTTTEPGAGQTTDSRFALSAGGTPAIPVTAGQVHWNGVPGIPAGETPAIPVTAGQVHWNGVPGIPAGETPASPVTAGQVHWNGVPGIPAGETPAIPVTPGQVHWDRVAGIPEGGTPAIPVTAGPVHWDRVPGIPAAQASDSRFALSADETRFAFPIAQTTNQSTSDPYVFPTRKERFDRYVKSVFGPSALLRSAVTAGINQWQDSPEEWEQGASGYGKRYASSFGRNAIQQTVVYGLDSALGLDTGFRRSPSKKFGARLMHALAENITSRTKSGKRVISVPRITGAYTSGVISREAWYPERYNYKDGLRSGTNSLLVGFALNVVREFVFKF